MKGRLIALDRLAAGFRSLSKQSTTWLRATDLKGKARARAAASRAAGGAVATAFVVGTLYALSRGLLMWGSVAVGLLSAWVAGGPKTGEAPAADGMDPAVFLELVHDVSGGRNVHLVAVREQLEQETGTEWSGPQVRALCDAAGIRVRDGVRVPGARPAVTTGIHRDDLPPLPRLLSGVPVGVLTSNNNANNNTNISTEEYAEGVVIVKHGPSNRQGVRS